MEDDGNANFSLDRTSAAILHLLAGRPGPALRQDEIATALDLHRSTLSPRLARLLAAGMVRQPYGSRSGYAATDAGRDAISSQPARVQEAWGLSKKDRH